MLIIKCQGQMLFYNLYMNLYGYYKKVVTLGHAKDV